MPLYEFACKCGFTDEQFFTVKELPPKALKCGGCKKKSLKRIFSLPSHVKTSKTFKTVGQLMEENDRKMGREQKQLLIESEKARMSGAKKFTGKLGKGMSVKDVSGPVETPWWRNGSLGLPAMDKPLNTSKLNTPKKVKNYIEKGEL